MRSNPWLRAGFDLMTLGFEASSVMTLRALKMSAGGSEAENEGQRMVSEKLASLWDLQMLFLTGRLGTTAPATLNKTVTHYRRKVRANRRRLSKG